MSSHFDEDFCAADITDEDELECMEADLEAQMADNKEQNDMLYENLKAIRNRIDELQEG